MESMENLISEVEKLRRENMEYKETICMQNQQIIDLSNQMLNMMAQFNQVMGAVAMNMGISVQQPIQNETVETMFR